MGLFPNRPATIYGIRNKENGRIYIGSTVDLETRIKCHFSELKCQSQKRYWTSKKPIFVEDFKKLGVDGFEVLVLEEGVSPFERAARENYYIKIFDAIENGYNGHWEYQMKVAN